MSFLNKVGVAFRDSYTELTQKVSWPTRSELTNSAVVVLIASLIIAAVVLVMDKTFELSLSGVYRYIAGA
ncbi:preprotein translocase subunit SecE [uncultured Porphyromonas sp.]|jgi:preprotein translocase, secE subunit|uniref:preprotein translocase subunit SecE n=1 Tax=uncultured Porphyromonas sp. TaxID=159274 RepID=UPI00261A85AB|nr:preprotein translocase subunit SecE [uncultured Porphyromonas sp.]